MNNPIMSVNKVTIDMHGMPVYDFRNRTGDSFAYAQEIHKPFGVLDDVLDWCKRNVQSEWRWQLVKTSTNSDPGHYVFYFDSDRDLCAFNLKWI